MVSGVEPETTREALAGSGPCHAAPFLVMVQEFTLVAFHDTVVVPPLTTRSGTAVIETVGVRTVTVTMFELAEPPGPVHEI